jgi:hypothetical protein
MAFSATDAAFEGFRLVRRNPLALVAWALLYAVLSLASLFALSNAIDPLIAWSERADALEAETSPTPEALMSVMAGLGEVMMHVAWLLPVWLLVSSMLAAAVARGVLTPRAGGFGYLRLGMDELRVLGITVVLSILFIILSILVFFGAGVIAGLASASVNTGVGVLLGVLLGLAGMALLIWLSVRLSLAVPITVAENRFALFDSFAVTRGRFWPLLGMAIIAGVMTIIISLLSTVVTLPLGMMSGLESGWSFGSQSSDPEAIRAALDVTNPWVIASAFVEAVIYALTVGVLYAPFAAAYRDLTGKGEAQ